VHAATISTMATDVHHRQSKICGYGSRLGMLPKGLESQITGASPEVQHEIPAGGKGGAPDDLSPPTRVLSPGHEPIHQIITIGDAGEHIPHVG